MDKELGFQVESLEQRRLMAVDVDVVGSTLRVQGDGADDIVQVFGNESEGAVGVRIGTDDPVHFTGIRSVRIDLQGGDDALTVSGLQIADDLDVRTGDGADSFYMNNEPPYTSFVDVQIGDDVRVNMGNDVGDRVVWQTLPDFGKFIRVEDDVTIRGAASVIMVGHGPVNGDSTVNFEAEDIRIGDRLQISISDKRGDSMYGPPEIELRNVNMFGNTRLNGSRAADEVILAFSNFHDDFTVNTRGGDDVVVFTEATRFGDRSRFSAGSGLDTLGNQANRVLASSFRDHSFEFVVTFDV